jgi:Flp pilus assembly protein TadB
MNDIFKKIITVIVMIFLFIVAINIVGFVLKLLLPLAVIVIAGYIVFRLINKHSANRY